MTAGPSRPVEGWRVSARWGVTCFGTDDGPDKGRRVGGLAKNNATKWRLTGQNDSDRLRRVVPPHQQCRGVWLPPDCAFGLGGGVCSLHPQTDSRKLCMQYGVCQDSRLNRRELETHSGRTYHASRLRKNSEGWNNVSLKPPNGERGSGGGGERVRGWQGWGQQGCALAPAGLVCPHTVIQMAPNFLKLRHKQVL